MVRGLIVIALFVFSAASFVWGVYILFFSALAGFLNPVSFLMGLTPLAISLALWYWHFHSGEKGVDPEHVAPPHIFIR